MHPDLDRNLVLNNLNDVTPTGSPRLNHAGNVVACQVSKEAVRRAGVVSAETSRRE